jgi:hypothetical protein
MAKTKMKHEKKAKKVTGELIQANVLKNRKEGWMYWIGNDNSVRGMKVTGTHKKK